ncbi:DUF6232 family protein [Streptomyces sp. NPDC042898]|uniref:DUF6232 family protein n=1 Tax=unclassified Streptomyces TaxID=2593676 RepID=UPI0033206960
METPEPPATPPRPWGRPAATPSAPSAAPHLPSQSLTSVDVSVSKRLLWVDGACYPLRNLARVHTYIVRPNRRAALMKFLAWLAVSLLVLAVASGLSDPDPYSGNDGLDMIRFVVLAFLVYALVDMLIVVCGASHTVLAIATTGNPIALVTSREEAVLRDLVRRISDAIENPEAEFRVQVERLTLNMRNYTGDTVNMIGGNNNTGVSR